MSELTVTLLRLGLLALLWVFVLGVVGVLRRDLYGTRVVQRGGSAKRPAPSRPAPRPERPKRQAQAERAVPTKLVVTEGSLAGTTIPLGQAQVLIGRSPEATLVLTDDYASGRHCRLYPDDGRWYVEDLGSTNGTVLGRERLTAPSPVEPGSRLRIGRTVIELRR
ncbi:FHA domain-containing protein FhaB/FipA [Thalassiella azotivora]